MSDMVKQPKHYISETGLEAKDVMASFGDAFVGVQAYFHNNIIKYALRCPNKGNTIQDLEKCAEYCKILIDDIKMRGILKRHDPLESAMPTPDTDGIYESLI